MARYRDDDDEIEDEDDRPRGRRGRDDDDDDSQENLERDLNRPRNDAYTGMLVLTFIALVAGSVLMYLDHEELNAQPVNPPKFEIPALGTKAPDPEIVKVEPPPPPPDTNPMPNPMPMPMPTP